MNNQIKENANIFTFEYIDNSNKLIFPLTFTEFIDIPNKNEINDFNNYLWKNYSDKSQMKSLIEQLLIKVEIPLKILVKYWIRAYTSETKFYRNMNFALLERKLGNNLKLNVDIFIRILYKGLLNKSITPSIDEKLYRGSIMKKEELKYIKDSLNKKKKIFQH